ncbi:MAG: signal recognition particle receptor subunit alpha, partial [Alphaproteobacteria bacterium]|nr:signal recognition particle receptor subunit alpha [Alphaproteobacteria bacterium]
MSWFQRLKEGLGRSSNRLVEGIGRALTSRKLDATTITGIEDALIESDLGPAVAAKLALRLRDRKFPGDVDEATVRTSLAEEIGAILAPVAKPFAPDPAHKPHVVLVVGVNGSGKTTTIGKLAHQMKAESP